MLLLNFRSDQQAMIRAIEEETSIRSPPFGSGRSGKISMSTLARDTSIFSDFLDFGAAKLPAKVEQGDCVELGFWAPWGEARSPKHIPANGSSPGGATDKKACLVALETVNSSTGA